ncbi:MAG: hypothetical protein A2046_17210 [Bacteroidetes bacterium GWA2_30_7]|nr:MAG: hypothetical protein A2046_17210 [Bacteroidetes bacterium GWA2_30_7]
MKKLFFILLVLCIFTKVYSQSYFNKNYNYFQNINLSTTLTCDYNDGYLIAGQIMTTDYRALHLLKIDENGDTIWSKLFFSDTLEIFYTGTSATIIIKSVESDTQSGFCITSII